MVLWVASAHVDMFFDDRNTARETRGRFRYQDEVVALRCIANLVSGDVTAVVVEWSTDYIAILADVDPELVSIKHREPGRGAWPMNELAKPLRDLYRVWREMGEHCRCAFASNAAVANSLTGKFEQRLSREISASGSELERFLRVLALPDPPLPRRTEITAVGIRDMAGVLSLLDRDPRHAEPCYRVLVDRIAQAATEEPPSPERRIARLTGSLKAVSSRKRIGQADQTLSIADLRGLMLRTESELARRDPLPIRAAAVVSRSPSIARDVIVGVDRFQSSGPVDEFEAPDGSFREERFNVRATDQHESRLARIEVLRTGVAVDRRLAEFDDEIGLHRTISGLPRIVARDNRAFVARLPAGSPLTTVYGSPPYPGIALDALVRALPTLARTLEALHAAGRAHRALRPEVLFASHGGLLLRDAGLAATAATAGEGPASYRAPEQDRPLLMPPGPATDVFQLAAILYHVATGQLAGMNPPPPSLLRPGLAAKIDDPLLLALAVEPARRPPLREFVDDLSLGGTVSC
jgi:hypothetical protein